MDWPVFNEASSLKPVFRFCFGTFIECFLRFICSIARIFYQGCFGNTANWFTLIGCFNWTPVQPWSQGCFYVLYQCFNRTSKRRCCKYWYCLGWYNSWWIRSGSLKYPFLDRVSRSNISDLFFLVFLFFSLSFKDKFLYRKLVYQRTFIENMSSNTVNYNGHTEKDPFYKH